MTRDELKALIEPTQDGAKFCRELPVIPADPIMLTIQNAIESAEDINDLSDSLNYGIGQLRRAADIIQGLENATIEERNHNG